MSLYEPSLKTAGNAEFVKNFQARYHYEPGYYSSFGYTAVSVLEAAVKKTLVVEKPSKLLLPGNLCTQPHLCP